MVHHSLADSEDAQAPAVGEGLHCCRTGARSERLVLFS
jgi:hypothetical protein